MYISIWYGHYTLHHDIPLSEPDKVTIEIANSQPIEVANDNSKEISDPYSHTKEALNRPN